MDASQIVSGIGRRLFQRLILLLVITVLLRAAGFFMGSSDDNFRSTSSLMSADQASISPGAADGWGSGSAKAEHRRPAYDRDGSTYPASDSRDDDGWGSN